MRVAKCIIFEHESPQGRNIGCVETIYLPRLAHRGPMLDTQTHEKPMPKRPQEPPRRLKSPAESAPNRHHMAPRSKRGTNLVAISLDGLAPWWGPRTAVWGDSGGPDVPDTSEPATPALGPRSPDSMYLGLQSLPSWCRDGLELQRGSPGPVPTDADA